MAKAKSVWGIDVGQCALKAMKLIEIEGEIQVDALEIIEHPKILSQAGQERAMLIQQALEQLQARQNLRGSDLAISVPGQSSLVRFVKLPVEKKRVPDIVRFEAEQQIPFPIDEVIWQYQTFEDPDSPDIEVGIFAMKRVDVNLTLANYADAGVNVDMVQMAPLCLYNFMSYDDQIAEEGATILADVGADKTDLVVHDGARIWARTIQIGGNNFTEALVRAFKLSFEKAEKLKRTAATSKYARQIFQAMRPVFADLVQEIQRSIGYYTSIHRETRFKKLVGLGNGFRLPGLQKFLEQNLNIPVARVDTYNNLNISDTVNAAQFSENVLSFAVSYGLALQGMGRGAIDTNLLPVEILRKRQWDKKRPWFAAAAAVLLACLAGPIYRAVVDGATLKGTQGDFVSAQTITADLQRRQAQLRKPVLDKDGKPIKPIKQEAVMKKAYEYLQHQTFWPTVQGMVFEAIKQSATDQQAMLDFTYAQAALIDAEQAREKLQQLREPRPKAAEDEIARLTVQESRLTQQMAAFSKRPRNTRKVIVIESWESLYHEKLDEASAPLFDDKTRTGSAIRPADVPMDVELPPGPGTAGGLPKKSTGKKGAKKPAEKPRGFVVRITGRTPMARANAFQPLLTPLQQAIARIAGERADIKVSYPEVELRPSLGADGKAGPVRRRPFAAGPGEEGIDRAGATTEVEGPRFPDPLLPEEDMADDVRFVLAFRVTVVGDGTPKAPAKAPAKGAKKTR